jgi:hypothetical protein
MHKFHPGLPAECPPKEAQPIEGALYRGILHPPVSAVDFLSHREANKKCTAGECECWGLSVWRTRDAVDHARATIRYIRRWHIAAGQVVPEDGVILPTPSEQQPEHHTFWRDVQRDVARRFTIILLPLIP